jgi:peptidoglycan/LPS O-acetylase OafA/YrhL
MQRMPQLDGLRAIAVGGVMTWHFWPNSTLGHWLPLPMGVQLFFALSGFLITGILLRGEPTAAFVTNFYLRRALRLSPLYFAVLAVLLAVSPELREAWAWFTFYGVNFWVVEHGWGTASHFWSLAVEEQFYLVWPALVLLLPRHRLKQVCIALIIFAPVFRLAMLARWHSYFAAAVLLPSSVDLLACGALLALNGATRLNRWRSVAMAGSLLAAIGCWSTGDDVLRALAMNTLLLPALYIAIGAAAAGIWRTLEHPVLVYLGQISYGLYVLHWVIAQPLEPVIGGAACAVITIGLAALSWHFFERPILGLRPRHEANRESGAPTFTFSNRAV